MTKRLLLPLIIMAPFVYVFFFDLNTVEEEPPMVIEPEPEIVICEEFPPKNLQQLYPAHWGNPPDIQTRDYRKLPEPYGFGSSTLANWITKNQEEDKKNENK